MEVEHTIKAKALISAEAESNPRKVVLLIENSIAERYDQQWGETFQTLKAERGQNAGVRNRATLINYDRCT